MMGAQSFENLAGRPTGLWVTQRFVNALAKPVVDRSFLSVEGAQRRAHYLACRGVSTRLDPSPDAAVKIAKGDGDRSTGTRQGWQLLTSYDSVILGYR